MRAVTMIIARQYDPGSLMGNSLLDIWNGFEISNPFPQLVMFTLYIEVEVYNIEPGTPLDCRVELLDSSGNVEPIANDKMSAIVPVRKHERAPALFPLNVPVSWTFTKPDAYVLQAYINNVCIGTKSLPIVQVTAQENQPIA